MEKVTFDLKGSGGISECGELTFCNHPPRTRAAKCELSLQEGCLVPSTGQVTMGALVTAARACAWCTLVPLPHGLSRWLWLTFCPPLTLWPAVPVLCLSLSPFCPARMPEGRAEGKQLLLFFPSSRSNLTPTERSSPRGSAHPCLARPSCCHDDCWAGNVLSHLCSARWVAVPGSVLRKAIPARHSGVTRLPGIRTDRKIDQVRGTHSDLDKEKQAGLGTQKIWRCKRDGDRTLATQDRGENKVKQSQR